MKGFSEWYIRLGIWGLNLFLLNLFWVLFSATGLFFLGLFPATTALFAVMRKLLTSDEPPIFKLFWKTYKSNFLISNFLGYMMVAIGFILYIDLRVLQQLDQSLFHLSFTVITLLLLLIFSIMTMYLFPVLVHYNLKPIQYVKFSLLLALGRPLQSLLMIISLAFVIGLYWYIPGLVPVFGVSLFALIIMKLASLSFRKPEIKSHEKQEQIGA